MFKKTLVALALAGLSTASIAADVTGADEKVSLEGVAVVGKLVVDSAATPAVTDISAPAFTQGSEYIVNDVVSVSITGAKFDTTVTPVLTGGPATFAFVDYQGETTARFRVSTANSPSANLLTLSKFTVNTAGAAAKGKVSFSSKAISVNPSIGEYDLSKATSTNPAYTYISQLSVDLTGANDFDAVITTSKGRQEFTGGGLDDTLIVDLTDASGSKKGLTFNKLTHVLKGSDFSFAMDFDADKDGKLSAAELKNVFAVAATDDTLVLTLNEAMNALTIAQTVVGSVDDLTVKVNVKGQAAKGSIINKQSFTLETTATTAGTGSASIAATPAGSWTLDGSSDDIELMPFGADYAQSITVANRGTVEGAITVSIKADGKTYTKELSQVAAANSVTNISLAVAAFAAESGVTGNAHVNVVVNAPKANIGVKGVYYHKASADRVLTY